MDIYAPSYLKKFKCTADKCLHSCCIGFTVEIDDESLEFYKKDSEIISKIDIKNKSFKFENNRCPFLNENNLCKIYIKYGEKSLCQICTDHPRFKNFYSSRTEIGLGLTCEEAARLIIDSDFELVKISGNAGTYTKDTDEEDFFNYRNSFFKRNAGEFSFLLPDIKINDIYNFLKALERLDDNWDILLDKIKNKKYLLKDIKIKNNRQANNLFYYFLFRYLNRFSLEFCLLCTYIILSIDCDIHESARMFSSEIEYSDENLEKLNSLI